MSPKKKKGAAIKVLCSNCEKILVPVDQNVIEVQVSGKKSDQDDEKGQKILKIIMKVKKSCNKKNEFRGTFSFSKCGKKSRSFFEKFSKKNQVIDVVVFDFTSFLSTWSF